MTKIQVRQASPIREKRSLHGRSTQALRKGMTLIEVIGVLAIIAILAAVVLPALIRQTDNAVAGQESVTLQSFANAFKNNVTRNRRIPGVAGSDWATNIANELGLNITDVTNNVRRQPRVFLVDTNGFGALTLPYTQNDAGTMVPTNSSFNARIMIISSLGVAVPSGATSAPLATSDFNNLWNWDSTSANFPTTGVWSGWTGNPYDITVQRLNLGPLFVNLWLSYSSTNRNSLVPAYSIDYPPNSITNVYGSTNYIHGYFLQNSILGLYYTNGVNGLPVTDSLQILTHDSSFVFDLNKWVNSLGNPTNLFIASSGGSGSGGPGIANFDFSDMVNGFLNAPGPTATPTSLVPSTLQTNVINSFINYMTDYTNWAASGFSSSSWYNQAIADQAILLTNVNTLVNNIVIH